MEDKEYYQAVIDCIKLLSGKFIEISGTQSNQLSSLAETVYLQLEKIEIELEKYVPRLSPLYSALNIEKESKGSESPYWEGIRDTTNLIRNYLLHNKENLGSDKYEAFLQNILVKSSQKLGLNTSPLIAKLDLDFEDQIVDENDLEIDSQEFLEGVDKNDQRIEKNEEEEIYKNRVLENTLLNGDFDPSKALKEEIIQSPSNSEVTTQMPISNEQTIQTSIDKQEYPDSPDDMIELSLDKSNRENTITNLRSGLLSQINNEITKLDEQEEKIIPEERKKIPIVRLSNETKSEDQFDENKAFSSSLKDALRMLRSDNNDGENEEDF